MRRGSAGSFQPSKWLLQGCSFSNPSSAGPHSTSAPTTRILGIALPPERKAERPWGVTRFATASHNLVPGDLIVHADHGVIHCIELKNLRSVGMARDFVVLEYRDDDRFLVPLELLDLVQKYGGAEKARPLPATDRLRGQIWPPIKARARKSMANMFGEPLTPHAPPTRMSRLPLLPGHGVPAGVSRRASSTRRRITEKNDNLRILEDR